MLHSKASKQGLCLWVLEYDATRQHKHVMNCTCQQSLEVYYQEITVHNDPDRHAESISHEDFLIFVSEKEKIIM